MADAGDDASQKNVGDEWIQKLEKEKPDLTKWRKALTKPDWRKDEAEEDQKWIRVYCIYETSEKIDEEDCVLGNCGVADPTLYVPGGYVDLEYHSEMTFTQLWEQFIEHVRYQILPQNAEEVGLGEEGLNNSVGAELHRWFSMGLKKDNSNLGLRWVEVTDGTEKTAPGVITDASRNSILEVTSPIADLVIMDHYTISFDDEDETKNKKIALMRVDHGITEGVGFKSPIYRFKKGTKSFVNADWINFITCDPETLKDDKKDSKSSQVHKGKWEEIVITKAGKIVNDKRKGQKGTRKEFQTQEFEAEEE